MLSTPWEHLTIAASIKLGTGSTGSGFVVYDEASAYLVTACHVLYDKERDKVYSDTVEVHILAGDGRGGDKKVYLIDLSEAISTKNSFLDYFIIKLGEFINFDGTGGNLRLATGISQTVFSTATSTAIPHTNVVRWEDIKLAEDVLISGYPSSIGLKRDTQFDYSIPLLFKGMVSSVYEQHKTIILDSSVYPGCSGSVVWTFRNDKFLAVGMVIRAIPYEQVWYNARDKISNSEFHNSRFSVALSIDVILQNLAK